MELVSAIGGAVAVVIILVFLSAWGLGFPGSED